MAIHLACHRAFSKVRFYVCAEIKLQSPEVLDRWSPSIIQLPFQSETLLSPFVAFRKPRLSIQTVVVEDADADKRTASAPWRSQTHLERVGVYLPCLKLDEGLAHPKGMQQEVTVPPPKVKPHSLENLPEKAPRSRRVLFRKTWTQRPESICEIESPRAGPVVVGGLP